MPGVANPSGLTLSYNGYTFPVSVQPPDISIRPVPDQAGRAVIYCEYTINLTATIYPDTGEPSASLQMQNLRERLSAPACELRIEGSGFSDLIVNEQGGNVWDAKYGPWPKVTACKQVGDNQAWQIAWTCVACVPEECPENTRPKLGRVLEWNYRISWAIDEHGLTRRTVSGHVSVPATRLSPRSLTIPDNGDRLREAVAQITIPVGFRRIPGTFDLSEDKRTLTFTVIDQQLESPWAPPPGVIIVRGTHSFNSASTHNFWKYVHTISADYTMARDEPKTKAWQHFRDLYIQRVKWAIQNRTQAFIPLSIQARESLWSEGMSFTLSYLITAGDGKDAPKALDDIMIGSGFWLAPPESGWRDWAVSLNKLATTPRGFAQMRFYNEDDSILNVCVQPDPEDTSGSNPKVRELKGTPPPKIPPGRGTNEPQQRFGTPPPKAKSWISYETRVRVIQKDEVARLKVLPNKDVRYRPRKIDIDSTIAHLPDYDAPADPPHVFQFRAEPSYEVEFEGKAIRAGYSIDRPRLTDVGGAKAYPINGEGDYFEQEIMANFLTPIAMAHWKQTYALETTPRKGIGPPDNPTLPTIPGVDDGLIGFTSLG